MVICGVLFVKKHLHMPPEKWPPPPSPPPAPPRASPASCSWEQAEIPVWGDLCHWCPGPETLGIISMLPRPGGQEERVAEKPGVKMTERFDCHHCNESLFGKKYILREESPYCVACFETLFANTCEECGKPIGCDCKDLSYKDRHWHEACFHCSQCRNSLVDKPFAAKEDQLLCTDCYSNEYSSKCQECKKTIMPGTRKMEYKGSSWHETCFICHRCQQPIGTKSFIPKDNQNFCVPCYEKQHAMQCVQCKKPITTGGVTYREQPWHKECFVCTACRKQLSGQRFTARDDFAYCLNCFCDLYAKKCAGCTNPISGLGGTKYISFEERQWHNDCFNCKKCSLSLVGRGFLTERDDILCPDCGKDI
uniref:LIM zinc-binding domain-containing protein n=1 Tax=Colobus angolensis palliatus TaxID=336983 RepID=A0A2K5HTW2_COLAP